MASVLPVYYQIMQTIKSWIVNKEFSPGQKIPSENELAERFRVSRLTARQAIAQLAGEGFITSRRGEGTFVTNNEDVINSASLEFRGCMDDLFFHQMVKTRIKSVAIETITPSRTILEKLALDGKDCEVTEIRRVQILRDGVYNHIANYLPAEIGSRISVEQLYERTLLNILEKDFKIKFTEAVQTIEASFASRDIAEKLGIASGSPVLIVERVMYTRNHKPIEVYQASYRGDLHRFIFRLKNVEGRSGRRWMHEMDNKMDKK
jgi:GntR family transcriptional regulator